MSERVAFKLVLTDVEKKKLAIAREIRTEKSQQIQDEHDRERIDRCEYLSDCDEQAPGLYERNR